MRAYNFSAGPAALPLPVLEQARDELVDWQGGASVMEVSHRGRDFMAVAERAEADLRDLLAIPADYRVLFMQGGATVQFAAVPHEPRGGGRTGRLRPHRPLVRARDQGGPPLRRRRRRRGRGRICLRHGARCRGDPATPERRLPALHAERDDRRRGVSIRSRYRRCAARRGHVIDDPVAADRRVPLRPDLRGGAEEHRPSRHHRRHRARGPRARRPRRHAERAGLPRRGGGRINAQYAADVRLVFRWARVPVAEARGRRRADGDAGTWPRQRRCTLRSTPRRSTPTRSRSTAVPG